MITVLVAMTITTAMMTVMIILTAIMVSVVPLLPPQLMMLTMMRSEGVSSTVKRMVMARIKYESIY